ncbi:MAG: hypothetical protein ACREL7_03595 [Longimicrobiales bacterium]
MNYVQATTKLIRGTPLQELADELRVSRGWLAHSRLAASNPQHRPPPDGWERAVARLARERVADLNSLVRQLSSGRSGGGRKKAAKRTKRARRR